jgi:hypothetical protein
LRGLPYIRGASYRKNPKILIPIGILIIIIFYFSYITAVETAASEADKEVPCEDRNIFAKLFLICDEDSGPAHSG